MSNAIAEVQWHFLFDGIGIWRGEWADNEERWNVKK